VQLPATDCARARESVSVQLDGELPELELDRLETHLRICPECSAWAEEVRGTTLLLREAGLEAPAEAVVLPRRGRRWRVSSAVALASAAAVVATMFFTPGSHRAAVALYHASRVSSSATGVRNYAPRLARLEDSQPAGLPASLSAALPSTSRVAV
jgi:predicted anti-sigma-YlaC factor YlaD